ncbi:MAG: 4Fe-4S dicluster domain-containing protein [Muribaculaceae bacterium]|nr:4Fe-4S dicluster domain-containing protein [Muribaculaceae bacterium]MDE6643091.1 4Fe-4S dicluster domain-containing protein [Muribaculaceae bacterium]
MIVCFSGTGNSLAVAKEVLKHLPNHSLYRLDHSNSACITEEMVEDNKVIWIFPTYSWGIPPVIKKAINSFNGNKDAVHHMITTCGDDIGNCASQWRKALEHRNFKTGCAFSVQMPNTYVNMSGFDIDSPSLEDEKVERMPERVKLVCDTIKSYAGLPIDDVVKGSIPGLKTSIVYPWFKRFEMNPAKFRVNKEICISCGLCASRCPLYNIEMGDKFPKWGNNCTMCLRCYHHCPTKAIDYAGKTIKKGQYTRYKKLVGE